MTSGCHTRRGGHAVGVVSLLVATWAVGRPVLADGPALVVGIAPDIPPYIMQHASGGLEVEIVRAALPGFSLRFVQMPYDDLETAIQEGRADVAVGVRETGGDGIYSHDFIAFHNYAVTRRESGLTIHDVDDLAGHEVLTWEGACLELGDEFKQLFSPGAPQRDHYTEFAEQIDQVRAFWQATDGIAVIDGAIFTWFSRELGHSDDEFVFHAIFPPATTFKVGFRDTVTRDVFNRTLVALCLGGEYAELLDRYPRVEAPNAVCDRESVRVAAHWFYEALNAMFRGDVTPMTEVWSHADDVTCMGPDGSLQVGWEQVRGNWEEQASMRLGGSVEPRNMHITVGRDLAVTCNNEIGVNLVGGRPRRVSIRATNLFRRENGQWRMIGHHTDLLPFLARGSPE